MHETSWPARSFRSDSPPEQSRINFPNPSRDTRVSERHVSIQLDALLALEMQRQEVLLVGLSLAFVRQSHPKRKIIYMLIPRFLELKLRRMRKWLTLCGAR